MARQTTDRAQMTVMTAKVQVPPTAVACMNAGVPSSPAPACATDRMVENNAVPAAPPNCMEVWNTALPSGVNAGGTSRSALVMIFENSSA